MDKQPVDWAQVEAHLKDAEEIYGQPDIYGQFAIRFVISPLRKRFDAGERTEELAKEIEEINL